MTSEPGFEMNGSQTFRCQLLKVRKCLMLDYKYKPCWSPEPGDPGVSLIVEGIIRVPDRNMSSFLRDRASLVAYRVKRLPAMQETWVQSLGREDPLEKDMATHSSTLAWNIPWTEECGRL